MYGTRLALADNSSELYYEELNAQAAGFAAGLRQMSFECGDRIALFMPNRAEYITALFGLFKGGFVAVPVNAKLHASELAYILEHSGARAVVFSSKSRNVVADAANCLPSIERINVDETGPGSFSSLIESGKKVDFVDVHVDPDDVAWIFYTSGTTGRPKGAQISHRNLCASTMNALAEMIDVQPEDVVLHVAPLSHGSGLYALPSIARGSRNFIYSAESFNPEDILRLIEREKVTIIAFLAPTMIQMLVETDPSLAVSTLRRVVYGGAPMDPGLVIRAISRFGEIFVQLYGQGEAPMTITYLPPKNHHGKFLTSVGIVRTDVEVRLVDESGVEVADGEEGEICVRGDVVMKGYLNDEAANAKALRGGWLHTGDVGRCEDGYLYLLSRMNDVIISGGSNIYPVEVENVLLSHPSVREVCVFGEPDEKWGESVVAAIVTSSPISIAELQALCRDHIASFKKPKRFVFVDSLCKNAYGKIVRREVRRRLTIS